LFNDEISEVDKLAGGRAQKPAPKEGCHEEKIANVWCS